ncbi:MAG: hypothetical protein QOH49_1819 [Acidobacteriota bacterium]|jgi:hypothetical protein|nr:hypothetical protein [Acidobacteriota bacterium]
MADEKTQWPSAERQLAEAKVPPDSALERLILENQDFHLLDPREANDDFDIPLWLRVRFRKQHPEVQLSTVNPGASYPEALEMIYKWMRANPDLPERTPQSPNATKGGV